MNRIILLYSIFFIFSTRVKSQNYSFDPAAKAIINLPMGMQMYESSEIKIHNLKSDTLNLKWQLLSNTLVTGWSYSLEVNNDIHYVGIPSFEGQQIINQGAYGSFKLDISSENISGSGEAKILVYEDGNQANADTMIFQVSTPTGIGKKCTSNNINLFPNPASGQITLLLQEGFQIKDLKIYNAAGEQIQYLNLRNSLNEIMLEIESLPSGIYFIKFKDDLGIEEVMKFNKI